MSQQTTFNHSFELQDAPNSHSVSIRLVAAAKPATKPPTEPEESMLKKPQSQPLNEPTVKKVSELPKKEVKTSPKKVVKSKIPPETKAEPQKPKIDKTKVTALEPKPTIDTTKSKPIEKKVENQPKPNPVKTPSQDVEETNDDTKAQISNSEISTQAKPAKPVLVEKPKFLVRPQAPTYPRVAKRKGMQGTVLIEVWLDKHGTQAKQLVLKSSGFDVLDTAALTAVKKWRFSAHRVNGIATQHRVRIPVRFNLD
nr:energy transducer TonB [Vibrio agarilyticus]